ncbi:hypothetical protein ACFE04_014014 [Oxalis oulophora]
MTNDLRQCADLKTMNTFSHVPPGFRFHPTDEELVDYYLRKKIASKRIDLDVIRDIDLYKIEPWDLLELCKIGTQEQSDWYFFSHKDKKYPTGTRTNRATKAGFWKATGRDKAIYMRHNLIGMRKTLVFYQGRAPNGQKSDWIMHEYRLETNENATPQEEGWVVCRVFKKRITATRRMGDYDSPCWYEDGVSFMPELDNSPRRILSMPYAPPHHHHFPCKQELELQYNNHMPAHHDQFLQLPNLESPKVLQSTPYSDDMVLFSNNNNNEIRAMDQVTDWRVLDKFVASQLSHEEANKETNYNSNAAIVFQMAADHQMNLSGNESKREEDDYALKSSSSNSSCQIDLWK